MCGVFAVCVWCVLCGVCVHVVCVRGVCVHVCVCVCMCACVQCVRRGGVLVCYVHVTFNEGVVAVHVSNEGTEVIWLLPLLHHYHLHLH